MAQIDSLEIQIESSAKKANQEINKLIANVGKLASSLKIDTTCLEKLGKINGNNFKKLGEGLQSFANAAKNLQNVDSSSFKKLSDGLSKIASIDSSKLEALGKIDGNSFRGLGEGVKALSSGLQNLQGVKKSDFNRLAAGIERLASIQPGNMESVGNALRPLADGINILSNAKFDNKNLQNLINSLTRLANANTGSLANIDFATLGNSINGLAQTLSKAEEVKQNTISMTNAIAKLASAGAGAGSVASAFPQLGEKLKEFINTMSRAPKVGAETIEFTQAIGALANAGGKAETTANSLKKLGDELLKFFQTMSGAPNVSQSTIQMTQALAQLANAGGRTGSAVRGLGNVFTSSGISANTFNSGINKLSKSMNGLNGSVKKALGEVKNFSKQALSAMGVTLGIVGAVQGLRKALDISSSLAEVQNVVNVTFGDFKGKIEDLAKTSITDYGMSELTAKQMAGRFQAMGTAIGFSQGKMSDMSVELTKLAGDMASFYNVEQEAVATSLQSVFTGETEPLRKYGLDLTNATLEAWALKQGIDADMQSMSQMEKVMLRYKYVVENTGAAQDDFLRTRDSWANQTRILKQNLEALAGVIGGTLINALKPLVKAMNVALGYITAFAKTVSNALGKIFGWTYEESGGGLTSDFEGAADGAEDIADSTGTAANNIKKMQAGLRAFDELKTINMPEADSGDTSGGGAGGGIGGAGAGADGKWKETDSIIKKFESEIDSLYKLGEYIGDTLSKAMESINWDKVYKKAKDFGKGLADFLNGLISPRLFGNLGKTIANSLNTALHFLDSFGERFDFTNFGNSLKVGLVTFLNGIQWKTALSAASNWGIGIAKTLNAFISPSTFSAVGETVANAINTAVQFVLDLGMEFDFKNLGKSIGTGLNDFIKNIKWEKVLKASKTWGKGIADALNDFISTTDFNEVGKTIANSINTVVLGLGTFIRTFNWKKAAEAIADTISSSFEDINWGEFGRTLANALNAATGTIVTFVKKIKWSEVASAILNALGGFLKELDYGDLAQAILIFLAGKLAIKAIPSIFKSAAISILESLDNAIMRNGGLINIGKNILSGIADGIKKYSPQIKKILGSIAASSAIMDLGASLQPIEMISYFNEKNEQMEKELEKLKKHAQNIENIKNATKIGGEILKEAENVEEKANLLKSSFLISADAGGIISNYGKIRDSIRELGNSAKIISENFEETKQKMISLGILSEEYYVLSSNYSNLTEEQKLQLKSYASVLSENIDGFGEFVDAGTGAFNGTKEELDNLVKKTQEYYIVLGAKQALAEYGEELFKLKANANYLAKELNEQLNTAIESNGKSYLEWASEIKGGTDKELAGLLTALEEVDYDYTKLNGSNYTLYQQQLKTNDTFAEYMDKIDDTSKRLGVVKDATDEVNAEMQEGLKIIEDNGEGHVENAVTVEKSQARVQTAVEKANNAAKTSTQQASEFIISHFSGAAEKSKIEIQDFKENATNDLEKIGAVGAIAGLNLLTGFKSNTSELEPYTERTMEGMKGTTISKSAEAGSEGGEKFASDYKIAISKLNKIGENTIKALGLKTDEESSRVGENGGGKFSNSFEAALSKVSNIGTSIMNSLDISLANSSFGVGGLAGANIGVQIANGIQNGMQSKKKELESSVSGIASGLEAVMKTALQIHSPSRVFFNLGEFTIEGFQNGIESMYQGVFSSMKHFGNDLEISPSPYLDKTYTDYQYANSYSEGVPNENTYDYLKQVEEATYRGTMRAIQAAGGIKADVTFQVEGDPNRIFKVTQKEADEFFRRTGKPAYSF